MTAIINASIAPNIALTVESIVSFLQVELVNLQDGRNTRPQALVRVSRSAVSRVEIDWNADVEVMSVVDRNSTLLLRGTVFSADEIGDGVIELDIRSWPDVLEDIGTPGIVVEDAERADIWSVLMTSGIDEGSIWVEGRDELPVETFKVVAPIDGLAVADPIFVGGVRLSQATGMPPFEVSSDSAYLAEPFLTCSGLALAKVEAQSLFEAEQAGLAEIDYALGTLLLLQRSASTGPNSPNPLSYSRIRARSTLRRLPVVAVLGRWGQRWMRDTMEHRPADQGMPILGTSAFQLPTFEDVASSLEEAIAAWVRAVNEVNRVAKLLALWECLEFYAAGAQVTKVFTRKEVEELGARATTGLKPVQVQRLNEVFKLLNSPPLMTRVMSAAEEDGAAISQAELTVLRRLRKVRNDIIHGRAISTPAHSDLRKGIGVANRLLLLRLRSSRSTTPPGRQTFESSGLQSGVSPVTGPPTRGRITEDEKRYALQAAETAALVMPYMEQGMFVPGEVQAEIRAIYADATEEALGVGLMRACDVALKHLARHFCGDSLESAADAVVSTIARLTTDDAAGFGSQAYADGAKAVALMAEAMIREQSISLMEEFHSVRRIILAFNAVLYALIAELATRYNISRSNAANRLGREISTIRPRSV